RCSFACRFICSSSSYERARKFRSSFTMKLLQAGILGFGQRGFVWAEINLFRISCQGILGQLKDLIAAIKCIYSGLPGADAVAGAEGGVIWPLVFAGSTGNRCI